MAYLDYTVHRPNTGNRDLRLQLAGIQAERFIKVIERVIGHTLNEGRHTGFFIKFGLTVNYVER